MTEKTFQWDPSGQIIQEFNLGVVSQQNKTDFESTTFVIENLTPGISYTLSANVMNIRTNQESTFDELNDTVWIESNIDALVFNKDHASLFQVHASIESDEIVMNVSHTHDDLEIRSLLGSYQFKYDFFAETETTTQCFQTYALGIEENDETFPLSDLTPNTYAMYYSLLVNPGDGTWYYVDVHKSIGSITFESSVRTMNIENERLRHVFNTN